MNRKFYMSLLVVLSGLGTSTASKATSYWYDYCHPGRDALAHLKEAAPSEFFNNSCYRYTVDGCEINQKVNLFKTRTTFRVSITAASGRTYQMKLVYGMNHSGDGTGICKLRSIKE